MNDKGKSPHFIGSYMKGIEEEIRDLAKNRVSMLFWGDPGTGKDLAAGIAADASGLELLDVNLATIKGDIGYSELFGHEKGSFTGATSQHIGTLEQAHGKLCFLNEIGTSDDYEVQKALLRFIEKRELVRRGGSHSKPIKIDTYIVGACQDINALEHDIRRRFKEHIELAPLVFRVKRNIDKIVYDILDITQDYFVGKGDVLFVSRLLLSELLLKYSYYGNVGELLNILDHEYRKCKRFWTKHHDGFTSLSGYAYPATEIVLSSASPVSLLCLSSDNMWIPVTSVSSCQMDRLCFDPPFKTSKSFEEWVKQQYDYGKMHQGLQMNPYVGMALAFGLVKIYLQEKNRGDYARVTSGINSNGSKQQLPKLKEIELKHILMRFEYFKHNKTKTAKSLGIHVDTLRSKLKAISDIAVKSDTE